MPRRSRRRPVRGDRGSLSVYVALFTPIAMVLTGLVVDGGLALTARERAADIAEQAARRVADNIDPDQLRAGRVVILPACASKAAEITAAHGQGTVTECHIDGDTAAVTITLTYPSALLGIVGLDQFTATAHATAQAVPGITAPGT
jgi:Flp pilus assembly protein TadG